jgi:hypothetical protein
MPGVLGTSVTNEKDNVNTIRYSLALGLAYAYQLLAFPTATAGPSTSTPAIIQSGISLWPDGGASMAINTWQKGGLLEGDRKVLAEINYFKRLDPVLGGFKSFELLQSQPVSQASQVMYFAINFQRGVVYARFLLYRPEQDWVVQNMDFNVRPEVIIPWMALPAVPDGTAAE